MEKACVELLPLKINVYRRTIIMSSIDNNMLSCLRQLSVFILKVQMVRIESQSMDMPFSYMMQRDPGL